MCLCTICPTETIENLRRLIHLYISNFTVLYPDSFIPKHHLLIHLPDQCINFGPLKEQFCLSFEAKHYIIKRKKWHNFKNICLSISRYLRLNTLSSFVNNTGDIIDPMSSESIVYKAQDIIVSVSNSVYQFFEVVSIQSPNELFVCKLRVVDSFKTLIFKVIKEDLVTFALDTSTLIFPWPLNKYDFENVHYITLRCTHITDLQFS